MSAVVTSLRPRHWFGVVLAVWLVTRSALLLVAIAVADQRGRSWTQMFSSWDVEHFLAIARQGHANPQDRAFFPGWPLMMRAAESVGLPAVWTGVAVALACSLLAALALHRLGGPLAAIWWLLCPTAVFTVVPYTEAAFCAAAFWAWERARAKDWTSAALLASLACGLRISGVFLVGALGLLALTQRGVDWRRRLGHGVLAALPMLVVVSYFAWLRQETGTWRAWLDAQQAGWAREWTTPWQSWMNTWRASSPAAWPGREMVGRVFAFEMLSMVVGAFSTVVLLVRRRWGEAGWVGVQVLAFATSSWFMSVNRAVLLWFPVFVGLAVLSGHRPDDLARRTLWRGLWLLVALVLVVVQLWWGWLFFTGQWAS